MLESENLSMISLPNFSFPEMNAVPLTCWQDLCLSKIWIPGRLLTNRQKPLNTWESRGIFHTLEKRDHAKQIESFSVYYSDSDNESEEDIFESDSDDAFDFDSISSETTKIKDDTLKPIGKTENCSELKSFPAKSNISLIEILNSSKEVDITDFEFKKQPKYTNKQEETLLPKIKSKNAKKKNKVVNSVTLDKFLEDYTEEDKQDDYANDYLRKVLKSNNKVCNEDEIQLRNNIEFPDLKTKEIEFMHNEKPATEKLNLATPAVVEILTEPDKENTYAKTVTPVPETSIGKIVIENIPSEISHEDILLFLCGYGEVKDFNLEQHGDFFKAFVENNVSLTELLGPFIEIRIDLMCDIDWIIECLNGTEPFGASSRLLKCYKQ